MRFEDDKLFDIGAASPFPRRQDVPSKILTAVGKSLTLRAALSAAVHTEGEGTRS